MVVVMIDNNNNNSNSNYTNPRNIDEIKLQL